MISGHEEKERYSVGWGYTQVADVSTTVLTESEFNQIEHGSKQDISWKFIHSTGAPQHGNSIKNQAYN
jgi:hypothetical protein